MPLTWYGQAVRAKVIAASVAAVNETTEQAAQEMRADHWWQNRSRNLERQTITEPARVSFGAVSGKVGTTRRQAFYGLFLELREPFMRPVGDRVFPTLALRIRRNLKA